MFLFSNSIFALTPKKIWVYGYGVQYEISYTNLNMEWITKKYNGKDSVTILTDVHPSTSLIVEVVKDRDGNSYDHTIHLINYEDKVCSLSMSLNAGKEGSKPDIYTTYNNPNNHKMNGYA